jgi:outer membrane protein OmpA-like peptidoglycan-associated protein
MSKPKKESFFWTSYADLMTSLFFVMLLLFVLTMALLHRKMSDIEDERKATEQELEKIREIEQAVNSIDSTYFDYNNIYKKHVLKIHVNFPVGISDMKVIDESTLNELVKAGQSIQSSLNQLSLEYPEIQYLLVIEGQASNDNYQRNYQLSYERALALSRFWQDSSIDFGENCEVLISGSGVGGSMRESEERLNQRFLIHIVPKPGIIEASKLNDL